MQTVGKYMIEIWKATGMDMNNVEFLWASEEVRQFIRKGVCTAGGGGVAQGTVPLHTENLPFSP